jgi:multidrug efflux pump subunit AcrB
MLGKIKPDEIILNITMKLMFQTRFEHPMALVILGGLISSTLLNLLLMLLLYWKFGKLRERVL